MKSCEVLTLFEFTEVDKEFDIYFFIYNYFQDILYELEIKFNHI